MNSAYRNEQDQVVFVRIEDALPVVFTPSLLSLLGYAISSGFIGSNIFLSVYYNRFATHALRQEYKAAVLGIFQIRQENTSTLSFTFGSVRHFLDDCCMHYSKHFVLPPDFISGSLTDFNAFLKGLILGSYSPLVLSAYEGDPVVFPVPNIDFANSLCRMLGSFNIDHTFYPNRMHMLLKPDQSNQRYLAWLLDPDSGSVLYEGNPAWKVT